MDDFLFFYVGIEMKTNEKKRKKIESINRNQLYWINFF